MTDEQAARSRRLEQTAGHAVCGTKIRFTSARAAQSAKRDFRRQVGGKIETYRCSICGYWHLGHPKRRKKRELRRNG